MKETYYVGEESRLFAREVETRFQKLPSTAGVIFVSVHSLPGPGGAYCGLRVCLGITQNLTEDVGWALIETVLKDEFAKVEAPPISAYVFVGFAGECCDKNPRSAGQDSKEQNDSFRHCS